MTPDPAAMRRDYGRDGLSEAELAPTWSEQFGRWFSAADGVSEPNAVVLATSASDGTPSARTVLLKSFDERGFVVFTNLTSRKGREALGTGRASLVFPWIDLERQVVVVGSVEQVSREQTQEYFRTRPRGSQVAAWASHQSQVIASRQVLEDRQRELEERFQDMEVPVPDFWGGLRIRPDTVEFWQGRSSRLHDRLRYRRDGSDWRVERLAP